MVSAKFWQKNSLAHIGAKAGIMCSICGIIIIIINCTEGVRGPLFKVTEVFMNRSVQLLSTTLLPRSNKSASLSPRYATLREPRLLA